MGQLKSRSRTCPVDQHCSQWARRYMGLCLCSTRDGLSFALGLISVISWGVAEVPQIITNYKRRSAEGLSIFFLLTWLIGDFFNLFGCLLEPTTLPTQYYMAVLYTATTMILFSQAVYYGLIYPRLKSNERHQEATRAVERTAERSHGVDAETVGNIDRREVARSSPIPLASSPLDKSEELYFMSARSLSVSRTPTQGSLLAPRTPNSDVEQQHWLKEPLLGDVRPTQSAPPKTMLCVVSLITFFLGGCNHQLSESHKSYIIFRGPKRGIVLQARRKILETEASRNTAQKTLAAESSGIGSYFGWGMAAIYLGGRLPQICLNIRRGNAEGLNPLMFVFALVGNSTYVASILVSSLEWSRIKPNLPWLVDAGGCVLLDIFIVAQFLYFRYRSRSSLEKYVS